jgi:hypothetical protein
MPSKDDKARRKEITHGLRDQQRQKTRESFPVPVLALKEMFDHLDLHLSDEECDDSLRFTREFLRRSALDESRVIEWLEEQGGHCDCEVLNNVETVVAEALPGYDDMGDKTGTVN